MKTRRCSDSRFSELAPRRLPPYNAVGRKPTLGRAASCGGHTILVYTNDDGVFSHRPSLITNRLEMQALASSNPGNLDDFGCWALRASLTGEHMFKAQPSGSSEPTDNRSLIQAAWRRYCNIFHKKSALLSKLFHLLVLLFTRDPEHARRGSRSQVLGAYTLTARGASLDSRCK